MKGRPGPGIVFLLGEEMPGEDGELAGGGDGSDLLTAPGPDT